MKQKALMPGRVSPVRMQQEQAELQGCFPTPAHLALHKVRVGLCCRTGAAGHCALGQDRSWGGGDASGELAQQGQGS